MEWWTEILFCTGWRNFLKCEFSLESHCKKLWVKNVLVRILYITRQLTLREKFADIEYEIGFALSIWLILWLIEKFQEVHIQIIIIFKFDLFIAEWLWHMSKFKILRVKHSNMPSGLEKESKAICMQFFRQKIFFHTHNYFLGALVVRVTGWSNLKIHSSTRDDQRHFIKKKQIYWVFVGTKKFSISHQWKFSVLSINFFALK